MSGEERGEPNVLSLRRRRPCPICGRPAVPEHRPFCSRRCADVDLARWLGGAYRIETDEAPADGAGTDGEE